jgi:hypothetical protein
MLTTLSTVKSRLAIPDADTTNDALLTAAVSPRAQRAKPKSRRDEMIIAQGNPAKREPPWVTAPKKSTPSPHPMGRGRGEGPQILKPQPHVKFTQNA